MIAFGRTANSFAGSFNTMTTSGIYLFNQLDMTVTTNDFNTMLDLKDEESTLGEGKNAKEIGKQLGKIFTKLYNVQVPAVKYEGPELSDG